jgi:hypothetical protein
MRNFCKYLGCERNLFQFRTFNGETRLNDTLLLHLRFLCLFLHPHVSQVLRVSMYGVWQFLNAVGRFISFDICTKTRER